MTTEAAVQTVSLRPRQLGEQAADASRQQAEAAGAKRLAAASEQAVRAERQAVDTLRQQLQEATARLGPLQDIEVTALLDRPCSALRAVINQHQFRDAVLLRMPVFACNLGIGLLCRQGTWRLQRSSRVPLGGCITSLWPLLLRTKRMLS